MQQVLRDQHNKEREARYGLKTENKVLNFVNLSIRGIFDDFHSYPRRRKQMIISGEEASHVRESINLDRQSVFHKIKRKKYLESGDETILTLDLMFRLQNYITEGLKHDEQLSLQAALNSYTVETALKMMDDSYY